ncbi:MAG: nitrite/sulfite reductase, partial [candidate division Zixibacteria bacterium]|nr:nitrite/sulfite reductase [candidate division Zixibacteria bacterium]
MPEHKHWAPDEAARRETAEFSGRTRDMILGDISNDQFRQFRLERGVYGQRQAGVQMVRIKIPYGGLTPRQLKRIAEITARFGHGIAHLTTRQDIQLHYVNLKDIPAIMTLLAEADITTREACGNTVRNVTACPFAGLCRDEAFDVTPHAHRTAAHLMRNPSTAGMGRKFKISFSGCDSRCGLIAIHDIGLQAVLRSVNGATERGFKVLVGGGLGAAPKAAQVYAEFVPEDELIPLCEAITRVFFLHGERDRRMKARMKFLIEDIGVEAFRELVQTELSALPRRIPVAALDSITPVASGGNGSNPTPPSVPDQRWLDTNVYSQRQAGYHAVTVRLILGDISATTLAELADLAAHHATDIRVTPEQNFLLRWIPEAHVAPLYEGLKTLGLSESGAGRLADITACPGADTCNLGITSSKGLARQFTSGFEGTLRRFADADIKIKISGCPNSCGQHHIADIGFYGCS